MKALKARNTYYLFLAILLFLSSFFTACGYRLAASPYQLNLEEPLRLSVPIATNHSRFGRLGPDLTEAVIERLSGTPGLILDADSSQAKLILNIVSVAVGSGSWDVVGTSSKDTPEASSSRTASVTVDAQLTRPDSKGAAISKRQQFYSYRTYMVSQNMGQVEMQEAEALNWVLEDISQKIGLMMFSEF
ncbi:MAG: LPS assembly lipoprotein LptE [Deltaproteobacteria bacterium]|jgi:hypothetical protein|nr:LPS assembly lipoprotein LptE [Deltaproteobacteria bacterium]